LTLIEAGLNRELFKGRRSLEPVGSRTDTVARGNVGVLVGWSCIENRKEFMSRGSYDLEYVSTRLRRGVRGT